MAYRHLWIALLRIVLVASSLPVIGQSSHGIIVIDADAVYTTETGQFTNEHLAAPVLPLFFSIYGAHKTAILMLNDQILERPSIGLSERIIVRGAAHIQVYDFRQPFVEPTPTPLPTATPRPTSTPVPPTAMPTEEATAIAKPTALTSLAESEAVGETVTATETPEITSTPTTAPTATSTPIPSAVDQVEKKSCGKAWGYGSESDLKEALLTGAKSAAVNELFGEQITSVTRLENFKLTRDDVNAISAGSVRVSGSPNYYNGNDFAQACVSIVAYVTAEDRAAFAPKSASSSRVCKADDNATGATLRTRAREAAVLDAILSYDRKLDALDPNDVSGLLRDAKFSTDSGFDPETGAYCTSVTGQVLPIEVIGLLNQ